MAHRTTGSGPRELVLALPSKGRLYDATARFFEGAGLVIASTYGRQYTAELRGVEGWKVLFQRAEEITETVGSGTADLGLTGLDFFNEDPGHQDRLLLIIERLGYGFANLVVAIPEHWIDVETVEHLGDLAISFRLSKGRPLRIATRFPNLTRRFLEDHEISDYVLVHSAGALESSPSAGVADLIVDLTSTGTTLTENKLRALRDGTVIRSQACLFGSRQIGELEPRLMERLTTLLDRIEARLLANETVLAMVAGRKLNVAELVHYCLGASMRISVGAPPEGLKVPSIQELQQLAWITCSVSAINEVTRRVRQYGAEQVLVMQPAYAFLSEVNASRRLRQLLRHTAATDPVEP